MDSLLGNNPVIKTNTVVAFNIGFMKNHDPHLLLMLMYIYIATQSLKEAKAVPQSMIDTYEPLLREFAS